MLLTKHGMRVGQNKLLVSKVELLIRIVATKRLGLVLKESLGSHSFQQDNQVRTHFTYEQYTF